MPLHDTIRLPAGVWTQITGVNPIDVRVQNQSASSILLQMTNGASQPSGSNGSLFLDVLQTIGPDLQIMLLSSGVIGADRVWALCRHEGSVSVSHADA